MSSIDVIVKTPDALTLPERRAWTQLRAANPALYSPYFHIGYTEALGRLRGDARVIVAYDLGKPVAFLPYQGGSGFIKPIGAPMTDYHGFIAAPDCPLDFEDILRRADIGAFHFSALVEPEASLSGHVQSREDAAMMDISMGADDWRAARDSSYRRSLKSLRRRIRKTEEHGERRFVWQSPDKAVYDQLIGWKKTKFVETGKYDVLANDWTRELLSQLFDKSGTRDLRCEMHALYFGDDLAAVDLGLTDGPTYHSWIVAYDARFAALSPGIQLLEGLIDQAGELGYGRIDLGAGTDGYKRYYATEPMQVGAGFIAVKGPAAALSKIYGSAERFGEKALGDIPGKMRRRYTQIAACEDTVSGRAKAMLQAVKTSGKS